MNIVFEATLFLWTVGWAIAGIWALTKKPVVNNHCRCRTEFRTGIRAIN